MHLRSGFIRALLALALGVALCTNGHAAQPASAGSGRIVVQRSPKFGTLMVLQLWIDGRKAASVRPGNRYDQPISAGHHVLTVNYAPKTRHQSNSVSLNVHPGETYVFTASWDTNQGVVLQRSSLRR